MMSARTYFSLMTLLLLVATGCTSTKSSNTARTGKEQLLISNAVDQALNKVDYRAFAGQHVYLDEKYVECVDKNYVISSLRHRLMTHGAYVVSKPEEAEVIVECRSGGVGTDTSESFLGIPEIALPGVVTLPEVRLLTRSKQTGTAKLGLVAYDAKSQRVLGQGGTTLAKSDDNNWYVMGVGPIQNGSIRTEVRQSTTGKAAVKRSTLPNSVAFLPSSDPARSDIQQASGEK